MASGGAVSADYDDGVKQIMEELTCSICEEEDRPLCALPCQHRFCKTCLDQWSGKRTKMFKCPTCRKGCRAPEKGFEQCRLSALVKEKLQAVPIHTTNKETSPTREDLKSTLQSVLQEIIHQQNVRISQSSSDETRERTLQQNLTKLKDIFAKKTETLHNLPDRLSFITPTRVQERNLPVQKDNNHGLLINCNFTHPIEPTLMVFTGNCDFSIFWKDDTSQWRGGRKYIEGFPCTTFHSLHIMRSVTDTYYVLQSVPKRCTCKEVHFAGAHQPGCGCYKAPPGFTHVLNRNLRQIDWWGGYYRVLAATNGVIYCRIDCHATLLQHIIMTGFSIKDILRFTVDGHLLAPIRHPSMQKPCNLKAFYNQTIDKTLVFVSDSDANKLFLFLDDKLCWEWQPEEFCKVGPVAISETTGYLYAVVVTDDGYEGLAYDPVRGSHGLVMKYPNIIKMFNLEGLEMKTLKFESHYYEHSLIRDIEVRGDEDSLLDNIFVSFKEHHDCDDNIRRGWEQFEAVPDFTSFQTMVRLLQYWINIAGRRRVNNIIFFIMSVAVLLTLLSSLSLLLTVLPLALLLACLAFLCWQSENDIVRKFDLDKHLIRFLRKLDRYFC